MEKDIYVRLVQKLYNVLYVQLLLNVACNVSLKCLKKFKQRTADASCPIVVKLLCHLTDCLQTYGLHFSDNTEHNNISSTSDVTDFMRKGLTEFLSLVVLLYAHIFQLSDLIEQNYAALSHNELLKELHVTAKVEMNIGNENGEVDIMPMNWSVEEAKLFIGRWCQSVETLHQIVDNENVEKKLYTPAIRWHAPSLISLPNDYDSLFQYYHKKLCESCKQKPKTPVLCLLCGKFLCYNVDCCSRSMYAEHIWHSLECGNGTALYLNIDTSLISIAKGLRNATWISVYLDKHGEEDKNLKRGKPLYLNEERYSLLNQMWITNSFDQFSRQWNFQRIN
ncbi:hypothetical protein HELRODRAFT_190407 [Helobdella robusta]|uniref:E3 ubiquitin-protein ligase n=1 Tax=Helobdella robusta TaxID=6412 RepID=T1FRY8_HELRO|nr:hypothetical protein HELRODRAFT_190407 [Helobdella robusta]ESO10207.1 hypothetical protein HELRODRAFT_190407 [Helobdella robusta]